MPVAWLPLLESYKTLSKGTVGIKVLRPVYDSTFRGLGWLMPQPDELPPSPEQTRLTAEILEYTDRLSMAERTVALVQMINPPDPFAVKCTQEIVKGMHEVLRQLREAQGVEDARVRFERFGY